MNTYTRTLLATMSLALFGSSVTNGQQTHHRAGPNPFAKVGAALAVFAVDESASKTGTITQPTGETVVAGPIELHLPQLSKPAWTGSMANVKPLAKMRLPAHAASHSVVALQSTHQVVTSSGVVPQPFMSDQVYEFSTDDDETVYIMAPPSPPHRVIRAPGQPQAMHLPNVGHPIVGPNIVSQGNVSQDSHAHRDGIHENVAAIRERHRQTHPDHSSIHRRVQPEPPTIPGAHEQADWKQPYSYGYFGASGQRHWSMQHGYRDRHTQWTRR